MENTFRVWAAGDSHVDCDLRIGKRKSLAEALYQSENGGDLGGPSFDWDIMIDVGDLASVHDSPSDEFGREIVDEYSVLKRHSREQVYNVAGNHDATICTEEEQWWFRKWIDPMGENTEFSGVDADRRPFPVSGTYERYSFVAGNVLFLMMSDRNDLPSPIGKGIAEGEQKGGWPAGAVTEDTFDWWVENVEANQDKIIVSVHHHMLKETTVASGPWEGFEREVDRHGRRSSIYHGYFPLGAPMGASYLYWVGTNPDAQAFERYMNDHPGCIDLWIGGHTHADPDDTYGGRSHIETKWGVNFLNAAALTRHGTKGMPMSRLLAFTDGNDKLDIQCYLHTSDHAPQGWYDRARREITLRMPYKS